MSAKTVDVLVFIPVIPAIPVLATWFLPWERWIPKKVPKSIIGPYLLYCSFAAWYFKGGWLVVGVVAFLGCAASVSAVFDFRKSRLLRRAQEWPVVIGNVIHIGEQRDENGLLTVTMTYSYAVQDEYYGGTESFKFKHDEDAALFKAAHNDGTVKIHYRSDQPDISAPDFEQ